ncbi:unnamed protein product [Orchesella dallaii]|uniref:Ubiquitinyl hydrolase 1 n=1 Tax=Orchesella dallaii TaxID=48710 RepID=A0ABP1R2R8_9HEXA
MDTCSSNFCPSSASPFGLLDGSSDLSASSVGMKLSALMVLVGLEGKSVDAVITNVSVIQSWRWFFHLSPFETIFLAFIIAQIGALSLIGILPININEYWQGQASGRRKRQILPSPASTHVAQAQRSLGSKLLILFKKLDQNECGFRALCELQYKVSCCDYDKQKLSWSTRMVLMELLRFAKRSHMSESEKEESAKNLGGIDTNSATEALKPFVEAVDLGSKICEQSENERWNTEKSCSAGNGNATLSESNNKSNSCERRYPYCPVTSEEIMEYVERINLLD